MGTPFQYVLHAVAIDAWYESSPDVVACVLGRAFRMASQLQAKKIAVVALATGYGHLSMASFARGLRESTAYITQPIEEVSVVVRKVDEAREIREVLRA